MMMKRFGVMAAAVCVLAIASPARAQLVDVPPAEVGLGLQVLRVNGDETSNTYPLGVNVDVALNRWGLFGLAFEGGWARDSTDVPGTSVTSNYVHFGAGPRFQVLQNPNRVRPYVQVLGGVSRVRFSTDFDSPLFDDVDESDTAFMIQPGVGVSIDNGGMWGFTGSVDYRRGWFDAPDVPGALGLSNSNEIRVFFGARMFIR